MPNRSRDASIILYCMGMSAIVVVIGFGFLRATQRDAASGASSQHRLMAQAAARAGVADATEAILNDYLTTSLEVGSGFESSSVLSAPPTFLDGPYRAGFVSYTKPERLRNVDDNSATALDDVPAEAMVTNPMMRLLDHNSGGQTEMRYAWYTQGIVMYDGRGRYIEPNYRNVSRQPPTGSAPTAVLPARFTDDTLSPERHNGIFLDASFHRIPSDGSANSDRAARLAARYRLRYALGVIDLGGHLLSTPKADLNFDWSDTNNEYRKPSDALRNAGEAFYNFVSLFPTYPAYSGHVTQALRWQHVFQGRGNTMNYDRRAADSLPSTFPYMFRSQDLSTAAQDSSLRHWGRFAENYGSQALWTFSPSREPTYYNLQPSYTYTVNNLPVATYSNKGETKGLYRILNTSAGVAFAALQNGGQVLPNMYVDYINAHLGPQPSWYTQQQSAKGYMNNYDACFYPGEHATPLEVGMLLPTPFGRGLTAVSPWPGSAGRSWYEGPAYTPWYINILTAPPRTIACMLTAYLPPSFKNLYYTEENFALTASKSSMMLGTWNTIAKRRVGLAGHDLFTRLAGPGFNEWPTPSGDGVDPNFQCADVRTPEKIYPGRQWNEANLDNLGTDIDTNTRVSGTCSHTGLGMVPSFWSTYEGTKSGGGYVSTPPAGWGAAGTDYYFQRVGTTGTYSYWWDVLQAASSAIAVVRAEWVQYPNTVFAPSATGAFSPPSLRDPSAFDSIQDLDRLFLRQLGENYTTPGDGTPLAPIVQGSSGSTQTFTQSSSAISNTIRTLVSGDRIATASYTSAERGKVMERVLNDFRLSFFGASPRYSDRFRPLDFDGDGKVMCSGYESNPTATADDIDKAIDRWELVDGSFVDPDLPGAAGRGPTPKNWFCVAGTFYIGKSHHYRIICRGELYDNISQRPVTDATLESVLVVDPEGTDVTKSHYLFQRWHYDRYGGHLSMLER